MQGSRVAKIILRTDLETSFVVVVASRTRGAIIGVAGTGQTLGSADRAKDISVGEISSIRTDIPARAIIGVFEGGIAVGVAHVVNSQSGCGDAGDAVGEVGADAAGRGTESAEVCACLAVLLRRANCYACVGLVVSESTSRAFCNALTTSVSVGDDSGRNARLVAVPIEQIIPSKTLGASTQRGANEAFHVA